MAGRNAILEFLLTSHPLDCPVCDKGGECPLQELTMGYGPGKSRFIYDDQIRLAKRFPLGNLIVLDRERCIQCARCTRYCVEVVGDDVLAFHERGRRLQIITVSDPPFDTKFSGNTTDICPVGALTTADFRSGARPWSLSRKKRSARTARSAATSARAHVWTATQVVRRSSASCRARTSG